MEDLLSWLLEELENEIEEIGGNPRLFQMKEAIESYFIEQKERNK